jgi:predicted nucleic acid-binding protein
MAARPVLVDSSFYIDRLRKGVDPLAELAAASPEWDIITCGMVILEVCRGFRSTRERKRFEDAFSVMAFVPTSNRVWQRATDLAWKLDRQGLVMQATDLLIATHALHVDAAVLTFDNDYKRVPSLEVLDAIG